LPHFLHVGSVLNNMSDVLIIRWPSESVQRKAKLTSHHQQRAMAGSKMREY